MTNQGNSGINDRVKAAMARRLQARQQGWKSATLRPNHIPIGDPCKFCGKPASEHENSDHPPIGDPCATCGEPAWKHGNSRIIGTGLGDSDSLPSAYPRFKHQPVGDPICKFCGKPVDHEDHYLTPTKRVVRPFEENKPYYGVDGEGVGRPVHKYVLLACSNYLGNDRQWVENPDGLSTKECLEFLLNVDCGGRMYAYAFSYDITKILEDVDNKTLWYLARPDKRQRAWPSERKKGPLPVTWEGYSFNFQGSKFTIEHPESGRKLVIWDTFRFYGKPFVKTLQDWSIGDQALWTRMQDMKNRRSDFTKEGLEEIRNYCLEECQCMAELTRQLVKAHDKVGLKLQSFYGAGSTATVLLKSMKIKEKIRKPPPEMEDAVQKSYFGGRFENSRIGLFECEVYSRDISSAYPYQISFLPCLEHGQWQFIRKREALENHFGLVHYKLEAIDADEPWAPFPHRGPGGAIWYPRNNQGWLWNQEFLAGEQLFPNHVKFLGAWIFKKQCDCKHPFSQIPEYYLERIRIGKEGPGYVLKLGPNSVYGKLVQSVGNPEFQCWVWGASITSGCRAQLIHGMIAHKDRRNLLAVATDGLLTLEGDLVLPTPRDTGTETAIDPKGRQVRKPLGGWEADKTYKGGLFLGRPGIYFPVDALSEDIEKIRARGFGRGNLLKNHRTILTEWLNSRINAKVVIKDIPRFCGFKNSIHRMSTVDKSTGKRVYSFKRYTPNFPEWGERSYGQWIFRDDIMTFDPMPKRSGIAEDGESLLLRMSEGESLGYGKGGSQKAVRGLFKEFREDANTEPDGYYADDFGSE